MKLLQNLIRNIVIFSSVAILLIVLVLTPTGLEVYIVDYKMEWSFNWKVYFNNIKSTIYQLIFERTLGGDPNTGILVLDHVKRYSLRSLKIIIPTFIICLIIGMLKGLINYYFEKRFLTIGNRILNIFFISIPDFFILIVLQYLIFSITNSGLIKIDLYGHENWYNVILPMIALSIYPIFYLSKIVYTCIKDEEDNHYVRTAAAKGTRRLWIVHRHILMNCLFIITSNFQKVFIIILSSLPIIELLSAYNGAGYQLMIALKDNNMKLTIGYLFSS